MVETSRSDEVDQLSIGVTPIDMYFGETYLARGSAFWIKAQRKYFLITTKHNLTGKNPSTNEHISKKTLAQPDSVRFDCFELGDIEKRRTLTFSIYEEDRPRWLDHPSSEHPIDVAAIPFDPSGYHPFPIEAYGRSELLPQVGNDVFILGYPLGIDIFRLPVWKRGTIASEPAVDVDGMPMFYVDTATAKGMSGSPVIHRATSGRAQRGTIVASSHPIDSLVGVYAGRVGPQDTGAAQLGIVWKASVITEIIEQA